MKKHTTPEIGEIAKSFKRQRIKDKWFSIAIIPIIIIIMIVVGYIGWRVERWWNWKFSYGNKVETKIELLEKRVEALEQKE